MSFRLTSKFIVRSYIRPRQRRVCTKENEKHNNNMIQHLIKLIRSKLSDSTVFPRVGWQEERSDGLSRTFSFTFSTVNLLSSNENGCACDDDVVVVGL